jgi:hypothetical protein
VYNRLVAQLAAYEAKAFGALGNTIAALERRSKRGARK